MPLSFSQALVLSGSDLLGADVREAIEAGLAEAGIEAEVTFDGSLLGLRDLDEGRVDASLLAMPDGSPGSTDLRKYPIGFQIVAVLAHESNPVTQLSYGELANLYEDNGTLENWSGLVANSAWRDRKVSLLASRRENAITLELFNALVLEGDRFKPSVRYLSGDDSQLIGAIINDPTALVLSPAIQFAGAVKLLAVKETETGQGYTPSRDNVFFGDYPLRLPFYLVVSANLEREILGQLLEILYSDAVTDALWEANLLSVPEPEQRAILGQFD